MTPRVAASGSVPARLLRGVLLGAFLLAGGCGGPPHIEKPAAGEMTGRHSIFVVDHGRHTGLILPTACLDSLIPALRERFEPGGWYEIGWGDKGFYQAKEVTVPLALQAFFASAGAVLHVVRVDEPATYFAGSGLVELWLTDQQLDSVCRFAERSFQRDGSGSVRPLGPGLYGDSRFYEAVGRYSMLHTCNTWTAKGLRSAGLEINPSATITAGGVIRAARRGGQAVWTNAPPCP
ncbi:MAG: TIGR02117 family protein [Desulfovibrionaceae bacterium]|nr:TIGR02117 family protein [Desulfovibrionaceae bacterium]